MPEDNQALEEELEATRRRLEALLREEDLASERVRALSRRLDRLVFAYLRRHQRNGSGDTENDASAG